MPDETDAAGEVGGTTWVCARCGFGHDVLPDACVECGHERFRRRERW